jgi:hypothetical protein
VAIVQAIIEFGHATDGMTFEEATAELVPLLLTASPMTLRRSLTELVRDGAAGCAPGHPRLGYRTTPPEPLACCGSCLEEYRSIHMTQRHTLPITGGVTVSPEGDKAFVNSSNDTVTTITRSGTNEICTDSPSAPPGH